MATRGRPPGQGKVPGSGRKKGSLDRTSRLLISERLAFDILQTYEKLGADWLFKVATERPDLFINQCLSKLLPPAFKEKEDPDAVNNTQNNYFALSPLEAARRVAFAISAGVNALEDQQLPPAIEAVRVTSSRPAPEPVEQPEMSPQEACRWGAPDQPNPSPHQDDLDPARKRWVEELPLTPEQRRDAAVVRETRECSIETYRGSSAEQGGSSATPPAPKPSAGDRRRAVMSRRGRDLL